MPICPTKTIEQRQHEDRWELVVGKELKDWATRVMQRDGISSNQRAGTRILTTLAQYVRFL